VVTAAPAQAPAAAPVAAKKKLSYKLQRELEALPGEIDAKEQAIAAVEAEMADAGFYQRPAAQTAEVIAKLEALQAELEQLVERWAELDA
jgi:ATP-binding cassette subfamily F protein uup